MAVMTPAPRSRGAVCGTVLIVLGLWGGLVPFVGPYFSFAYTPNTAWSYNTGRFYYSIIPGAVALICGLFVALTRQRLIGILAGVLAALAGGWFVLGSGIVQVALRHPAIGPGTPVGGALGGLTTAQRAWLEQFGFFTGVGLVVVLVAALAIGRFSLQGARDAELAGEYEIYPVTDDQFPADTVVDEPLQPTTGTLPTSGG